MDFPKLGSAVFFGLITMVTWGLWVVFSTAASESIDPKTAAAISYLVAATLAVAYVFISDASLAVTARGSLLAVVAGVFAAIGLIATYLGLSVGSTTTVATIGAMYFVVATIIGMVVLGDEVTTTKLLGIAFAAVGVLLIAQ